MLKFTDIIMTGKIMYNKTFKFLSKKMVREEIIDLLKSVYEHSKWVPERLLNENISEIQTCLLYTSPSPRDSNLSRMPSSA